jgi:hypothetical protein
VQESAGGCGLVTDCVNDIICVDIVMSVDIPKTLDSYNIWVEYDGSVISREAFMVNNNTPVGDNSCVIANGNQDTDLEGPSFNPDHWRVSGVPGMGFSMLANTPYIVHTICFIIQDPMLLNGQQVCVGGNVSSLLTTVTFTDASSDTNVPETCMVLDGSFASCSILPVELLNFAVKKAGGTSILDWSTATEINSDYFEIQRAAEDKIFSTIGKVKGAGTTNELTSYQYVDYTPERGTNFYRLKQVDYDGQTDLSPIRSVNFTEEGDVSVYPIPANEVLYVNLNELNFRRNQTTYYEIFDTQGRSVLVTESQSTLTKIDITSLNSGAYFLQISNESVNKNYRFIKEQ